MKARKQKTRRKGIRRGMPDRFIQLGKVIDIAYKFITILTILVNL